MTMKKFLIIVLCAVCIITFLSYINNDSTKETPDNKNQTFTEHTKKEVIVYVSESGKKIHSNKKCSGMKYYKEMTYDEAVDAGYEFCTKCN